jgi:putative addiction module CopG family antidote
MNVSLTPELERFVGEKVKSGLYNNASEVVREGLRLLKEQDEIQEPKAFPHHLAGGSRSNAAGRTRRPVASSTGPQRQRASSGA